MIPMLKKLLPRILILILAFGGLTYWFSTQKVLTSRIKKNTINTQTVAMASSELSASDLSSPTSPENTVLLSDTPLAETPLIEETPTMLSLREVFAAKYNKSDDNIFVAVDSEEGDYAKGSVDFDKSGYPATFYAYNQDGVWVIVAVENGVVACTTISGYSFPSSMIPQCYNQGSGTVVSR